MFELSIKSSKNIKELNIIFEDSEQKTITYSDLDGLDGLDGLDKPKNTTKVSKTSKPPKVPKTSKPLDDIDDIENFESIWDSNTDETTLTQTCKVIAKPEIPDTNEVCIAQELQNLDI